MKLLGFTSTRADYDLLSHLYKKFDEDKGSKIELIVSGSHLSKEYGMSINQVCNDGIQILAKIQSLLAYDSKASRVKTSSIFLQNSIEHISKYNPDVLLYAGDREDTLCAAMIGSYLQVPSVHFYGGDHVTDGHVDNPVRHAISKLSSVHMVTLPEHKRRLMAMGEPEERIHVVGALSLDRFVEHKPDPRDALLEKFGLNDQPYALVIFHPQDREIGNSAEYLKRIVSTLRERGLLCFVAYPNTDPDNKSLIEILKEYDNRDKIYVYQSLKRDTFLSLYKNANIQVGNSSAGIVEAASIPVPVVNVGKRQTSRAAGQNVIFSGTSKEEIKTAIDRALSPSFIKSIQGIQNIYGDGKSTQRAFRIIKEVDLSEFLYKTEDPLDSYVK